METVFDRLAKELNKLPEEIQQAFEETTIKEINATAQKMQINLKRGSGSESLNNNMVENTIYNKGKYYEKTIDWDDKKIVNEDKGYSYGKFKDKPRARKKRNYSLRPATYHDLAYIINYGRGANFSQSSEKIRAGNYFITKATRNAKNWRTKRDKNFRIELANMGKKFE